jgi:hypothetical protein
MCIANREMSVMDVSPDIIKDMYARSEVVQLEKHIMASEGVHSNTPQL